MELRLDVKMVVCSALRLVSQPVDCLEHSLEHCWVVMWDHGLAVLSEEQTVDSTVEHWVSMWVAVKAYWMVEQLASSRDERLAVLSVALSAVDWDE